MFTSKLRDAVEADMVLPLGQIYSHCAAEFTQFLHGLNFNNTFVSRVVCGVHSFKSMMNRWRRESTPSLPSTIGAILLTNECYTTVDDIVNGGKKPFIVYDGRNDATRKLLVFGTFEFLRILNDSNGGNQ